MMKQFIIICACLMFALIVVMCKNDPIPNTPCHCECVDVSLNGSGGQNETIFSSQ
jgi:hypothetical protein